MSLFHGKASNRLWSDYQDDLERIDMKYDGIHAESWSDINHVETARAAARSEAHKRYEHACAEFRARVQDDDE